MRCAFSSALEKIVAPPSQLRDAYRRFETLARFHEFRLVD